MGSREIVIGGRRTRIVSGGSGEPLVLIHGGEFGMLYSLDAWDTVTEDLERDFTTVAFDRLGQGGSDNPDDPDGYTFAAVLEHVTSVFEALCDAPAHVVGHSRGGLIAARLAQVRPDLVKSLIVVDSNSLAPVDPATPQGFYAELEARLPDGYRSVDDVRLEPLAQSYSPRHITDAFAQSLLGHARLPKTLEAQRVMREVKLSRWYPDVEHARDVALGEIDARGFAIPVGVIWGLNDPSAPPLLGVKLLERLAPHTADATLHILGQAGHYVFREQPRRFTALVRMIAGRTGRTEP